MNTGEEGEDWDGDAGRKLTCHPVRQPIPVAKEKW